MPFSSENLQTLLEKTRQQLNWEFSSHSAQEWWRELEEMNEDRSELIFDLARELMRRGAGIEDFFLACSYSGRERVRDNLAFLDLMFQDRKPLKPNRTQEILH